nr:hypothetical protein [Providencia stuartii]
MKNNLEDLHNHLFAQLERLSDEDLKDNELRAEINRAKALSAVASQIISNGQLAINVQRLAYNDIVRKPPKYLEVKSWVALYIQIKCVDGCVNIIYSLYLN